MKNVKTSDYFSVTLRHSLTDRQISTIIFSNFPKILIVLHHHMLLPVFFYKQPTMVLKAQFFTIGFIIEFRAIRILFHAT